MKVTSTRNFPRKTFLQFRNSIKPDYYNVPPCSTAINTSIIPPNCTATSENKVIQPRRRMIRYIATLWARNSPRNVGIHSDVSAPMIITPPQAVVNNFSVGFTRRGVVVVTQQQGVDAVANKAIFLIAGRVGDRRRRNWVGLILEGS